MRTIDGEIAHPGERIAEQSEPRPAQAADGGRGDKEVRKRTKAVGVVQVRGHVLERHSRADQHVAKILCAMNTVVRQHLGVVKVVADGPQLLDVPDEDRQRAPLQCGQRVLAGRIAQVDHQQRVEALALVTGHHRVDVFPSRGDPREANFRQRRQRGQNLLAQPTFARGNQRRRQLLVHVESQCQQADPRSRR